MNLTYNLRVINILIFIIFISPIKIKSAAGNDNDITAGYIPVNIFFAHWIKEIDIKRYGNNIPILPLSNTVNLYRYSDKMLQHMPKKALKTFIVQQKDS